ncbi:MAG: TolC family protein [Verrucomicrobiota bacterium]|jgi:outer membrane protein
MNKLLVLLLLSLPFRHGWAADSVPAPRKLTLRQAQELALKQNPKISVADLVALASQQATKELQSALLPNIFASATAVGTADPNNTRIAAGALNNPLIYEREADGATISQLITDFGRSWDLTRSAKLRARSERMNVVATRAQILLEVNNAYFSALESQSVLQVARETLRTRRLMLQQTQTLATNQLKSQLDVSFASVDYDQAGILLAKARMDVQAGFAVLSTVLGERSPQTFQLADEPMPPYHTNTYFSLVFEAWQQRPDLVQLRYQRDAAREFAQAERKLDYPSVNAVGTAGVIPTGNSHLADNYAAAGIDLDLPLYTGGLNAARRREADLRARAADEAVRDEEDRIGRDVQLTSLNLDYAYERLALTEQLLHNATEALELAQARFKIGSSSIIELSQAELNETSAQIAEAAARYDYQIQNSALDFQLGRLR